MVVQTVAPTLPWVMEPESPSDAHTGKAGGFRRTPDRLGWILTPQGIKDAGTAQRMLLRYVLFGESRKALGATYGYSDRETQAIITGERYGWLTLPVRRWLLSLGIGNLRMNRSDTRTAEIRQAFERVSTRAVAILRDPHGSQSVDAESVRTSLYLLSGIWREDEG